MGWTFYTSGLQGLTPDQQFRRELEGDGRYRVVAAATRLHVYYAAVENVVTGTVDAFVALHRSRRDGSWGYKDMDESMGPCEASAPARILDRLSPLPACVHWDTRCRHCGALIVVRAGIWRSHAGPGQVPEVAGPCCYSGYRVDAPRGHNGRPRHAPGGLAHCSICQARDWRQRCRAALTARAAQQALLRTGARVRLAHPRAYSVPLTSFTVSRRGRVVLFRGDDGRLYRFSPLPTVVAA